MVSLLRMVTAVEHVGIAALAGKVCSVLEDPWAVIGDPEWVTAAPGPRQATSSLVGFHLHPKVLSAARGRMLMPAPVASRRTTLLVPNALALAKWVTVFEASSLMEPLMLAHCLIVRLVRLRGWHGLLESGAKK